MCSWDRFLVVDSYPGPGEYAIVNQRSEQDGGTTSNLCHALARLGVRVRLVSSVGDDTEGRRLVSTLTKAGCDTEHVAVKPEPTDSAFIVVSGAGESADRTIYWLQGARPAIGDRLPVDEILGHRWILIDVDDHRLRRFLLELPAHRGPRSRLIGTMTYLLDIEPATALAHALEHDIIIGNERELMYITQTPTIDDAIAHIQSQLGPHACRALYVSQSARGSLAIRRDAVIHAPAIHVEAIDTTGAGDAFAAGCIWGILDGESDERIIKRGNVLGGLACRTLGARAALPDRQDVEPFLTQSSDSNDVDE